MCITRETITTIKILEIPIKPLKFLGSFSNTSLLPLFTPAFSKEKLSISTDNVLFLKLYMNGIVLYRLSFFFPGFFTLHGYFDTHSCCCMNQKPIPWYG